MERKAAFTLSIAAAAAVLLTSARHRAVAPYNGPTIDINRSLVVVDPAVIEGFTFARVMRTLVENSGAASTDSLTLYRQLFDTQNPKPGLVEGDAPHCDDFITGGKPSYNGFPRRCPTAEGILATTDPFTANDYAPIGITNRFDLTPADGSNCGQYRIIFAKMTVKTNEKLHFIFEPVLPNPKPSAGVEGCRPVAQFWADLSQVSSMAERRARIERFFFEGIDGFPPVLRPERFDRTAGRIRTLQKGGSRPVPRFYQFHLVRDGSRLLAVPGLLENSVYAPLFNAAVPTPLGDEFRKFFISQVPSLANPDINLFSNNMPEKYLIVESDLEDITTSVDIPAAFDDGNRSAEGRAFRDEIDAETKRVGSPLTPFVIVGRSWSLHCSGCHIGASPVPAPVFGVSATLIDERPETIDGVTRSTVSPILRFIFAPNRARILHDFLIGKPLPAHSNGTIGGGRASD